MATRYMVRYRCPDCVGEFQFAKDADPPDRCPLCGAWVNEDEPPDAVFVPQAPAIRKSLYAKSVDQTYRSMEAASIDRAREAADQLGVSEAEMSHIKITNMRDPSEMREGDTAAILPAASSAAAMNLTVGNSRPGFQALGGGVPDHAPGVGGYAERDNTVTQIRQSHHQRAVAMARAGNMGRYTP